MQPKTGNDADSKILPTARSRAAFADIPSATVRHYSARFITGAVLIASSFLVYLAYPIILLVLPASGSIKVGATIAASLLSWGVFSLGIFLTGTEGYELFKAFWRRAIGRLRLKNAKQPVSGVKQHTV
jgi:hypothetical protein